MYCSFCIYCACFLCGKLRPFSLIILLSKPWVNIENHGLWMLIDGNLMILVVAQMSGKTGCYTWKHNWKKNPTKIKKMIFKNSFILTCLCFSAENLPPFFSIAVSFFLVCLLLNYAHLKASYTVLVLWKNKVFVFTLYCFQTNPNSVTICSIQEEGIWNKIWVLTCDSCRDKLSMLKAIFLIVVKAY